MKRKLTYIYLLFLLILLGIGSGIIYAQKRYVPPAMSEVKHVSWSKNAVIYEVNIRQYSKSGTFKAFEHDLPRLKALGVEILWIMPVNPIGEKDRKGKLGSYYSVKDYKAINPEFGTMDDFKHMVSTIHKLGMKVILDWVPNHTSLDNNLVKTHPEYYLKDSLGRMVSPFDWTDVYRLDYTKPATRQYMTQTMQWWLKETDLDGFRCDVAHMIPVDYWNEARVELEKVKPVFMLAEAEQPFLNQKAFDMTYDWTFHHLMNDIAKGKAKASAVFSRFVKVDSTYPGNSYLMEFTSNHDENSWNGSEYERMGAGARTFAVLSATTPGMFLIYNGQESAFKRRLKFFEKDSIDWDNYSLTAFYKKLISLKKTNHALWNGVSGDGLNKISTGRDSVVCAYIREKGNQKVVVICNLSPKAVRFSANSTLLTGAFKEIFTGERRQFNRKAEFNMKPWQYLVFDKEK